MDNLHEELTNEIDSFRNQTYDEMDRILQPIMERIVRLNRLIESVRDLSNRAVSGDMDDMGYRSIRYRCVRTLESAERERKQLEKLYRKYSVKREKLHDYNSREIHF